MGTHIKRNTLVIIDYRRGRRYTADCLPHPWYSVIGLRSSVFWLP